MRKRITMVILVAVLGIAFALPLVAMANDTARMEVTYTIPEPPEPPGPPVPDFIIHIPSSISISRGIHEGIERYFAEVIFTWENNNLVEGEWVNVHIDVAQTLIDGTFYLHNIDNNAQHQRIGCVIFRGAHSFPTLSGPVTATDTLVAGFNGGIAGIYPSLFGRLFIQPFGNQVPGTYTGTIHFIIERM